MTGLSEKERSLRAYLLGELAPEEQQRIEAQLLSDSEYVDSLLFMEDELMDSYVSDMLSGQERKQFEEYFLSTPERRRKLRMAKTLRRYINNQQPSPAPSLLSGLWSKAFWRQPFTNPVWRSALTAMLILGFGLVIMRAFLHQSLVDKGRSTLQASLRESPIEARMAGFDWTPKSTTLSAQPKPSGDNTSMDRALSYFRDAIAEQPGPESHYAFGQYYLAKREFGNALEQFDQALEAMPKNAKLHSDMGAALLEMALLEISKPKTATDNQSKGLDSSSEYLYQSLEHLNRAVELDDSLLEALFNRALCHQRMLSLPLAEADWQSYLSRDASSSWADEARRHLKEIEDWKKKTSQSNEEQFKEFLSAYQTGNREAAWQVVSQTREVINGRIIWWQLLTDFFALAAAGQQAEANARIEALRYVGNLELNLGEQDVQRKGDPYISELARFYRSASPRQRADLSRAHEWINEGNQYYIDNLSDKAVDRYSKAQETFARLQDEGEALMADLLIAYSLIDNGETKQSAHILEGLIARCGQKDYRWLLAHSFYSLAMTQDRHGKHSKALENTEHALRISEEISDTYNIQRSLAQIADQYRKLGNYELSTTYMNRCLEQVRAVWPGNRQMWRNCNQLTQVLAARRFNAASAAYASEGLRLALETKDPACIYLSYVHSGLIQSKQQDYAEAIHLAQLGFEAAPNAFGRAYASLQLGNLRSQAGDLPEALSDYDQSINYINSIEAKERSDTPQDAAQAKTNRLLAFRYEAHKGRLFCLIAQRDDVLAEEELVETLRLLDEHRESILEEQNRNKFFNVEQSVYDAAIDFEYSRRNNNRAAFERSEESRAQSLRDMISTASARVGNGERPINLQPMSLTEVQRRLPDQIQLIEYVALDAKLLICVVSKSAFSIKEVPVGLSELTDKVLNFRQTILRNTTEPSAQARELYKLLIAPFDLSAEKGRQICIVPDKVLNNLSFGALVSPASGRYLIEDYQFTVAPSATIYLAASERTEHTPDLSHERLLAVCDPAFDTTVAPSLPSTRAQVNDIAGFYPSPLVLSGAQAREETVKREMEEADVIHLASHYEVLEGDPMNSRLLLAQESRERRESDSSAGFLQADEVFKLNLQRRAPLVILSACQSGVEHYYNGEGMIGMSRVFIAAGAPVVVASMWKVDVHATDDLMVAFHTHRKLEGRPTAEALRLAQIDLLNKPSMKHPYYWAGFITIGGYTSF